MIKTLEIIEIPKDVTEDESNTLALKLISEIGKVDRSISVKAFLELSACRIDGVSYSEFVSEKISEWIFSIYLNTKDDEKDKVIDLVRELEPSVAHKLANSLLPLTENEHLKYALVDAAAYAGT